MAIIPGRPSLGAAVGSGLAQGLESALESYKKEREKNKMLELEQMRANQLKERIGPLFKRRGLEEELAFLDPRIQLSELQGAAQKQEEERQRPQQEMFNRLILGLSPRASQAQQMMPQSAEAQEEYSPYDLEAQALKGAITADMLPPELRPQSAAQEQAGIPQGGRSGAFNIPDSLIGSLSERQAKVLADLQNRQQELRQKDKELSDKQIKDAFKLTKPERKEILEKSKRAQQNLSDLQRLEELDAAGNLTAPGWNEYLTRSGLDIGALRNPDSEEFQKITAGFLRDAKQYFGGRITNFEIEQFMRTIPTLSNTKAGRRRVIANLKRFNRMANAEAEALREILKENDGVPPFDLMERIDDRVGKKRDAIVNQFKKDLASPKMVDEQAYNVAKNIVSNMVPVTEQQKREVARLKKIVKTYEDEQPPSTIGTVAGAVGGMATKGILDITKIPGALLKILGNAGGI